MGGAAANGINRAVSLKLHPSRPSGPVYFLSDAHIGTGKAEVEREKERRLLAILDEVEEKAAALVFLGDLFDFWFEYRHAIPRRGLAIVTSGAGLVFLILALNTQGLRESATTAVFLVGRPYVTGQVSASASLPYYVATALCLLLGTLGLSVSDEAARRLRARWLATAIVLSLAVTATRFWLEKVAAPDAWSYAVIAAVAYLALEQL